MKLLNRSIRSYLIYAAIVLLIAIPVFYFVIQSIVEEDVDENLMAQKNGIILKLEQAKDTVSSGFLNIFEPEIVLIPSHTSRFRDTLYTISVYDKISDEKTPYRVLESNIPVKYRAYTLQLRKSLLDSKDLIESIVTVMAVLLLIIIAGLIIINRSLSRKIWKPFYSTLHQLRTYRVDMNEPLHFNETPVNEFNDLNNTITSLAQRNQQVYQSQKEFTENASHEMQTPLAIFQNKLELLMQTAPLSAEQAGLIEDLATAGQRMNRLNKNLLLLTKIENNQFPDKEPVSVRDIIEILVEQYKFQADKKQITVQLNAEEDIWITANKALIEILLSNLLSNAIRHNSRDGAVNITFNKQQVTIQNTATGNRLDPTMLFRRFQKQNADSKGIGLGLEIVKKITDFCHFTIEYKFIPGSHNFLIHF